MTTPGAISDEFGEGMVFQDEVEVAKVAEKAYVESDLVE